MKIDSLYIENFKSIKSVRIEEVDNAFILVGKNNAGKSSVIDAIRAVLGEYKIRREYFQDPDKNVVIEMTLSEKAESAFGTYHVRYVVTPREESYYEDDMGEKQEKPDYLPRLYYIDHRRNLKEFQSALLNLQGDKSVCLLRENKCPYKEDHVCDQCFECIDEIERKTGAELNVFETAKLMEYRLYKMNLDKLSESVNKYLKQNGMLSHTIQSSKFRPQNSKRRNKT